MDWKVFISNLQKARHARFPKGIVCRPYRFIYFPVPKAATSTMKHLIGNLCDLQLSADPQVHEFETVDARDVEQLSDFTSLAIVRNPWARLHSCYKDKILLRREPGYKPFPGFTRYNQILGYPLFSPEMSFEDFITVVSRIPDALSDEHFRSQCHLLYYPANRLLPQKIARFENLETDIAKILSELNLQVASLPRVRINSSSSYREHFSKRMADKVSWRYRRDIEAFQYRF